MEMSETDNNKICALYCRVSTSEQAEEGYSIGEQERLLLEYCEKNGYQVYKVFSDKGISAKNIKDRPAMIELLQDASEKKFNMVISWKINRISRKLADALKIVETLENYGITYRSYSEPFETDSPAGKMQFQMMALVGEFERSTIAENVKMGMIAKANTGEWCGGIAPLGYDWQEIPRVEKGARKKSKLVINDSEAEIVREIFNMYASGKGYKAIANHLNKKGLRTKRGNMYAIAGLRDILTNPVYIGMVRFNVRRNWNDKRRNDKNPNPVLVEGIHEAIVDKELWDSVQYIMKSKAGKPSRIYDGEYPLTGLLRCPECGAGMVLSRCVSYTKSGEKRILTYYACSSWKNKGSSACHSNMIPVKEANHVVYDELKKVLTDKRIIKGLMKRLTTENRKKVMDAQKSLEKYEREIEKITKRRNKLFTAFEDNIITSEELLERKNELNKELESIYARRDEAVEMVTRDSTSVVTEEFVEEVLNNFEKLMSETDDRECRKQLLHLLISEITVDADRNIDSIKLKLTSELLAFLKQQHGGDPLGAPSFCCPSIGLQASLEIRIAV